MRRVCILDSAKWTRLFWLSKKIEMPIPDDHGLWGKTLLGAASLILLIGFFLFYNLREKTVTLHVASDFTSLIPDLVSLLVWSGVLLFRMRHVGL